MRDLPERYAALRSRVLQSASHLASLPPSSLDALTCADARYLVGWSHGKETLKPGVYDTLKGSFYVNCAFYNDPTLDSAPAADAPDFPEYTAPNVWPTATALPAFRAGVEQLCTLIIDVAALVARACDRYAVASIGGYEAGYLERVVRGSLTTKARLLHYFPPVASAGAAPDSAPADSAAAAADEDSWCATHVDHGCLTGLTSALFVDETHLVPAAAAEFPVLPASPDPATGLYIRSRTGDTAKVGFPADCLAFQTGEALERITQGRFRAVPHFVRGPDARKGAGVARNTLAVFTQPNLGEVIDEMGTTFAQFCKEVVARNT